MPHLEVVLAYAEVAGIPMELIVDDDLDLPKRLPSAPSYKWIMKRVRRTRK